MRIRSIKPEFWRSDDITELPIPTRLTFIGLWSYVDDNGVGADKLVSIVADLYADDFSSEPLETVQRVTEDLQRLSDGRQVIRYRGVHNGSEKDLLYITKWKHHQRVNHPSLGHQYPLPPAEMLLPPTPLKRVSSEPLEPLFQEQGNRGTGERGSGAGEMEGEPPPRCTAHMNDEDPPRCHGCRRAREANEAWKAGELERRRKAKAAAKAIADDCGTCHGTNWIPDTDPAVKCNHQEAM